MSDFSTKLLRRLARSDGKLRFGSAEDVREDLLAQFYEQMYPERAAFLKQHWRWLYQVGNEPVIPSPMLAIANERIVGHGGLIKVRLQRGGDQRDAIWMMDFGVLPEYQRGIIGAGLVQTGMEHCPLRVAFLNERSWGMVSKMGWQTHFQVTAFQLPLRPEKLRRVQQIAQSNAGLLAASRLSGMVIRAVSKALTIAAPDPDTFAASGDLLEPFMQSRDHGALRALRSEQFWQWRLLSHPHADQYFVLKTGSIATVARVMKLNGCRRLHLLTLEGPRDDRRSLSHFFAGVVRWALSADVDTSVFLTSDPEIARVASRWLPLKSKQRFAFHADDDSGWQFLGGPVQRWELLDSDFEMMFESEA